MSDHMSDVFLEVGFIANRRIYAQGLHTFAQTQNRFDYPARAKILRMGKMNYLRQGCERDDLEWLPHIGPMGKISFAGLGKINPIVLIAAVGIRVMSGTGPEPSKGFMIKPKLGRRYTRNVNPAEVFMINPREVPIPKIAKPIFIFPGRNTGINDRGFLPDQIEPGSVTIIIEDFFDGVCRSHGRQSFNI